MKFLWSWCVTFNWNILYTWTTDAMPVCRRPCAPASFVFEALNSLNYSWFLFPAFRHQLLNFADLLSEFKTFLHGRLYSLRWVCGFRSAWSRHSVKAARAIEAGLFSLLKLVEREPFGRFIVGLIRWQHSLLRFGTRMREHVFSWITWYGLLMSVLPPAELWSSRFLPYRRVMALVKALLGRSAFIETRPVFLILSFHLPAQPFRFVINALDVIFLFHGWKREMVGHLWFLIWILHCGGLVCFKCIAACTHNRRLMLVPTSSLLMRNGTTILRTNILCLLPWLQTAVLLIGKVYMTITDFNRRNLSILLHSCNVFIHNVLKSQIRESS